MEVPSLEEVRAAVGGTYEVERLFGRGGMGAVYLGRHATLGSAVAIKVLPVPAIEGSDWLARFTREARLAANLPHPHIVPVYEFAVRSELAFLIMPFVEGVSLASYLQEHGRLDLAAVREMLRQVGSGLVFAHDRGVVHRDIKPANILRETATGRWLLTDFGIARVTQSDDGLTLSGMVVGTPAYMAPEQAVGAHDVDARADLYSLAAVACEALTGTRPDTLKDSDQIHQAVRQVRADLPSGVVKALTTPLALDRDRRPGSVSAWIERLDAVDPRHSATRPSLAVRISPRKTVAVLTAIGLLVVLAAGLLRFRGGAASEAPPPTIAIAPFAVTGVVQGLDLKSTIPKAFEDQLWWIPGQRVLSHSVVSAAATQQLGAAVETMDAFTTYAVREFGANEILFGTVTISDPGDVRIQIQVWERSSGRVVRSAEDEAPLDSLSTLIASLVTRTFAERASRDQTGYAAALPRGLSAIQAYLEGGRLFRSGAYSAAVAQFDAVIEHDSAFAPAYFKRMLSEVLRLRPTRATDELRSALAATQRFRGGLDPTTTELLRAYELIVADGDIERAHEVLQGIVDAHPNAVDAWFILGYLRFYLGAFIGTPRSTAEYPLIQAHQLAPGFAAPVAQLALLAYLEGDTENARRRFREYLALDQTSPWAELVRMSDSMLYGGVRAALAVRGSFPTRAPAALEILALGGGNLDVQWTDRLIARDAIDALANRAVTAKDRETAFRLQLAHALGTGQLALVDTVWREARRRNVPQDELDRWMVVTAVTSTASLGDSTARARALERLAAAHPDDPTVLWLAARWYRGRNDGRARAARTRLAQLAADAAAIPFVRSLADDLAASDSASRGDTAAAFRTWRRALSRYSVELVPFGLIGSLWPVRVEYARVADARRDADEVLAATAAFGQSIGYLDQVAWRTSLPLRARALQQTGDLLGARTVLQALADALRAATGPAAVLRDSVTAVLGTGASGR